MVDRLSVERRSALMSKVKSKDTSPEMRVRRLAHALGYRYRLHRRSLPGSPDLVFSTRRKVIFVHGCFWHRHPNCRKASMPKSRVRFWSEKFERNVQRDRENLRALRKGGWEVLVVWECQTKDVERLEKKLRKFLG
ncbi:very short patch repair endonuclease [Parvibaculum sp.]|uniref:very short patch repair endonuclease n=1 Tax=Parvibaculum sp. TaxID=2024848 RepID=UPI003BA9AEB4